MVAVLVTAQPPLWIHSTMHFVLHAELG